MFSQLTREDRYELLFSTASKLLVWGGLFGVVYLLRSFSLLMFLVFVFSYVQANVVDKIEPWIASRPVRVTLVGALFLASLILAGAFIVPQFRQQAIGFATNFSTYAKTLDTEIVELARRYPIVAEFVPLQATSPELANQHWDIRNSTLARILAPLFESSDATSTTVKSTLEVVGNIGSALFAISSQFLLSLLFSFLIVYDLPNLKKGVMSLRDTRLRYVYEEVSDSLIAFGQTMGRAFEAQIQIAIANTILTAIGIWLIHIRDQMAFISLIVFFCSFVPIAGVFISSVPICLVALQQGGVSKVILAILLITLIHTLEAYVLNPHIFGHHLRLNSVVVLILVTISGKIFGLWGLILCLPVATYIFKDAIQIKKDPNAEDPLAPSELPLDLEPEPGGNSPLE